MQHTQGCFAAAGGIELYRQSWRPDGKARGVVVLVHGLGESSGVYFMALTEALTAGGFCVHAFDLRGHGRSARKKSEWGRLGRFGEFTEDLLALVELARREEAGLPLFLFGHSLGGLIALDFALEQGAGLAGVAVTGPALAQPEIPAWMKLLARLFNGVLPNFQIKAPFRLEAISDLPEMRAALAADPLFHPVGTPRLACETEAAQARVNARAAQWRLPLLLLHGTADGIVPDAGSRRFFAAAAAADKTYSAYAGLPHHLLISSCRARAAMEIAAWMAARI